MCSNALSIVQSRIKKLDYYFGFNFTNINLRSYKEDTIDPINKLNKPNYLTC